MAAAIKAARMSSLTAISRRVIRRCNKNPASAGIRERTTVGEEETTTTHMYNRSRPLEHSSAFPLRSETDLRSPLCW